MSKVNKRKTAADISAGGNNIRPLSKYGFDDFMKLAINSFRVKKYGRAADNCRLAAEIALRERDNGGLVKVFDLWLNALLEDGKFGEVKKICCEARSKLGSYPDLLFYEFKVARNKNEAVIARKLGEEYIEMLKKSPADKNAWGINTEKSMAEIMGFLEGLPDSNENNEMEK
jgi:hypothetical protein